MRLKKLEIKHKQYYSTNPTGEELEGVVEFFNGKGVALQIRLEQRHMEGLLALCASGLAKAATEACSAIASQALAEPNQG